MAMNIADVISKVEKLLALGTSDNEHEAALAVAKAQDLLLAYGLSMEQVSGKAKASDVKETGAFDVYETGKTTSWKMDVLRTVAKTSGVYVAHGYRSEYVTSKHAKYGGRYATFRTAFFIGLPADVELAGHAYQFLVSEIERLGKAYAGTHWTAIRAMAAAEGISNHDAESRYVYRTGTHPLKAKASWVKGAALGVIEMLQTDYNQRTYTAGESGTALIVNRDAIIRDYLYQKRYGKTYAEYQEELKARMASDANPAAVGKPLTPAQLRKLNESNRKWAERQQRKEENEAARRWAAMDGTAFFAGRATGRKMTVRSGGPSATTRELPE